MRLQQDIILHKEQHAIMESLTDYGYSGIDNGNKANQLLQNIKSTQFEAAVNVAGAHIWNSMEQILMQPCLIWAKLSQKRALWCNLSILQKPEFSW